MHIVKVPTKTKDGKLSHLCILMRESYRENGKVKKKTIANLTHCKPEEIEAIQLALEYKDNLSEISALKDKVEIKNGKSIGAVYAVYEIAKRLGIAESLGNGKEGKLALWQVIARVIEQGSRLSAVRLAEGSGCCDVLGIRRSFDEDDLYSNLDWLNKKQEKIEDRLFSLNNRGNDLFLYDVTSSYFEGMENELADWGYNRDGKKGKKQVVAGLLCDKEGEPVSVDVYRGNTNDQSTFTGQVNKVGKRFGCKKVIFVGDRGMIKRHQINELGKQHYYITAITKPEIEKMLKEGLLQMELFDEKICEIGCKDIRYITKRNPFRAEEMRKSRDSKKSAIIKLCEKKNKYLAEHKKADVEIALRDTRERIVHLKISEWFSVKIDGREIIAKEDKAKRLVDEKLDGCYVIRSNVDKKIKAETIHDRYKDLAFVERGFRTCKTGLLELRPWYLRKEERTRAHAFVVMLAYMIVKYLAKAWKQIDLTVEEGLRQLSSLSSIEITVKGASAACQRVPLPNEKQKELLSAIQVEIPKILPKSFVCVVSRRKLVERRLT